MFGKKLYKLLIASLAMLTPFLSQATTSAENNDFFRNIGKINVVIAVILIIFVGIIIFLVYLDRKISRLETESKEIE